MDERKNVLNRKNKQKEPVCENLSFAAKEAFKRLRTNVDMSLQQKNSKSDCRIIGVTSAQLGDGKSIVALNLAYSFAELGRRVLLVDADMRRPSIDKKLGLALSPGLSNLLRDTNSVSAAIQKYRAGRGKTELDIIPGGSIPQNPAELLSSKRMTRLLEVLASAYDVLVLDLPPVGIVIDAVPAARQADGMIIVVRENACPRAALKASVEQLKYAGINILGFVVNGALEGSGKKYIYGKYY